MVTVEVVDSDRDLEALRPAWTALLRRSSHANPFLTWEWCEAWWRHYRDGRKLWILVCFLDAEPIAILPLFRKTGGPFSMVRTVKFLGSEGLCSDYLDAVVARGFEPVAWRAIADFLEKHKGRWDVLQFDGMPADSSFVAFLGSWSAHVEVESGGSSRVCPYVLLPDTWDGFLKSVSSHRRHEIRRTCRRLRERGTVTLRRVEDPRDLPGAMDDMVRLHQRRWTSRGMPGNFASARYLAFHRDVCRRFLENGILRLTFMELEGRRVAFRYQFRYGDKIFDYQTGFEELPGVGVGSALLAFLIEREIAEGVREHDFLRGDEAYKYRWGVAGVRELSDLTITRPGLGRMAHDAEQAARARSKEVVQRYLPPEWQEAVRRWVR